MLPELDLTGKVALVTGGARGIGKGICEVLSEQGASVVILDYPSEEMEKVASDTAKALGGTYVLADVAEESQVEAAVKTVMDQYGRIDILVNNAGITKDSFFHKQSDEDWDKVLQTNLYGSRHVTKFVYPIMRAQKYGRIIFISSVVALMGNYGQANYCASKAGLIGFAKDLATEAGLLKSGITVNVVCPGFIDTPMTQAMKPEAREAQIARIPLGRQGTPREIALAVLGLVINEYTTGEVVNVNGGLYM